MADIFMSYASDDLDRVEPLAKALEEQGWSVFWDRKIPAGKTWREVIGAELDIAKCIIVLWSTHSVKSRWVIEEADFGLNREILIPAKIDNVNPPLGFGSIQAAGLIDWDSEADHPEFISLLNSISEFAGPPTEKPKSERYATISELPLVKKIDPKSFTNSIGITFVLIPAGKFMMGSKIRSEKTAKKYGGKSDWFKGEHPQHEVTISKPFYIQSTAVTQGQWKRIMGDNPSHFKRYGHDCPVEMVSWDDALKFIRKINQIEGTQTYRLPTEAEWEYSCRAGTTTDYSFGDDGDMLSEYAWFESNSNSRTHTVGTKKPNPFGLSDMHGNVWEWCRDWYGDYPSDQMKNPAGPSSGQHRVLRGGSWLNIRSFARCAYRYGEFPGKRNNFIGFRCAKTLK